MQNIEELKKKVLDFVRLNGPILPVQLSKVLSKDLIYTSAILSSLVASGYLKITNVKIGGSPLYYTAGQEYKLQHLNKYLKDREQEAFELLKDNKLLRESELQPVQRVALREIKDFAVQILAKDKDREEIFWKWFLLPDQEAKSIISTVLSKKEPIKEEIKQEETVQSPKVEKLPQQKEIRRELFKRIEEEIKKPRVKEERKISFQNAIDNFIKSNNIKILGYEPVRKDREVNMVIELPTSIGSLKFFLKAKNKKSVTNADLLLANNEAQQKNLPIIFLTTGKPAKKYLDFIEKNLKNQLIFKQIN
ncbi:MAG: hypothetical protein AB1571_03355 [Nanoarchaeota archaeon]